MQLFKTQKAFFTLLLALVGMGYFGSFSLIDINPILQNYLAFLPIQLGVLVYMLWWLRKHPNQSLNKKQGATQIRTGE
ncbi:MAG: hypothetical protein HC881_13205 [Leptolyngbyaceae cyanobacterium SL_7_1]|nr:hypothetical protein [Leptolyngbyaceae cyanobacterium SL_7_1]